MGFLNPPIQNETGIDSPLTVAKSMLRSRRRINDYFPAELFADPARDILLDLFVSMEEGRDVSVTSCCIASAVPPTTALRHIETLKQQGFVVARPDLRDHRRIHLYLTEDALEAMRAYLLAVARSHP